MKLNLGKRLLPDTDDLLLRGRAGLVMSICTALAAAVFALILTWLISGDLEGETVIAGIIFSLLMGGIIFLAHHGRAALASWILIILLMLLITLDASSYGLGEPGAAAYIIPILVAICTVGFWAGMVTAIFASLAVWLIAWAPLAGWFAFPEASEISHLTFNAPFYTVVFILCALIAGLWAKYLSQNLKTS